MSSRGARPRASKSGLVPVWRWAAIRHSFPPEGETNKSSPPLSGILRGFPEGSTGAPRQAASVRGIGIGPAGMWVSAFSGIPAFDTHTSWVPTVYLPAEDAPQSSFSMKTRIAVCEDRLQSSDLGNWRRVPESNRSSRICNPLRNLSANPPPKGGMGIAERSGGRKGLALPGPCQAGPMLPGATETALSTAKICWPGVRDSASALRRVMRASTRSGPMASWTSVPGPWPA